MIFTHSGARVYEISAGRAQHSTTDCRQRQRLTEVETEGDEAPPWVWFVGIRHLPDIPAAEVIDNLAIGILDLPPFYNVGA